MVKTIETIRLENYRQLVKELADERGRDLKDPEVSAAFGISKVYAWQLRTGKRESIDSKAARKIEAQAGRREGWLDTNFAIWPFPDIDPERFERLTANQKIEIQGSVRKMMIEFESTKELNQEAIRPID